MQPPSQQDPTPVLSGMVQKPRQQSIMGAPSTNATAALVLSLLGIIGIFFSISQTAINAINVAIIRGGIAIFKFLSLL
jgi:hypothetical protein